jgi:hypothetical protein
MRNNGNISNLKAFHVLVKQGEWNGWMWGDSGLSGSLASAEGGSRLKRAQGL